MATVSLCAWYYYFEFQPFITFCVLRLAASQHADVCIGKQNGQFRWRLT